jgi:tRNA U34 2-thiouridine synthase MnmA/TrmU
VAGDPSCVFGKQKGRRRGNLVGQSTPFAADDDRNRTAKIGVAMSGGVDSSATAALLLEQGYDVVGITLKLWPQDCVSRAEDKCCGPQAVTDARSVCHKLGIPYYLIDEAAEFQKHVIQYFADEYKAGRTPNPCVMCNQNLKFGRLIERADQLGAMVTCQAMIASPIARM